MNKLSSETHLTRNDKALNHRHVIFTILIFISMVFASAPVKASDTSPFVMDKVTLDTSTSKDSDTIRMKNMGLSASGLYESKVEWKFGMSAFDMSADQGSGLRAGNVDSGTIKYYQPWLGLRLPLNDMINADMKIGYETTNGNGKTTAWKAGLDGYFFNSIYSRIFMGHTLYAVSPLAISRDIEANLYGFEGNWNPIERFHLAGSVDYMDLSDGNTRWRGMASPSWFVSKTGVFDFSLGLKGTYFRFDKDLSNGYYDPQEAQKYLLTYDIGINEPGFGDWAFSGGAGRRKDDRIGEFDYALEFNADASFTLHPGIDLGFRAAALREGGGNFQPYWWREFGLNVMARF